MIPLSIQQTKSPTTQSSAQLEIPTPNQFQDNATFMSNKGQPASQPVGLLQHRKRGNKNIAVDQTREREIAVAV